MATVQRRDGQCVHITPTPCDRAGEPHHVWRSGQGGPWAEWNLVMLCHQAHRWVHGNPIAAAGLGLLVPAWTGRHGALEAVQLRRRYLAGDPRIPSWLDEAEAWELIRQLPEFGGGR